MQPLTPALPWGVACRRIQHAPCRPFLVAHCLILICLLSVAALNVDAASVISLASLILTLLAGWTLFSWHKLCGTLFDPYPLFLMSSWLFNGGQILLEVARLNKNGILGGAFSPETTLKTAYLVAVAITAMHLGALWAASSAPRMKGLAAPARYRASSAWHTRMTGWILFAVSIGPAIWSFREAFLMVLSTGYFSLYQRTLQTGFASAPRLVANFLIPSALFLLAGSRSRRFNLFLSGAIIILYAAGMFFIGGRSAASTALIAYLWLYSRTVRQIPAKILIAPALVVVFVVCPFVGATRDTSGAQRTSVEFMRTAWSAIDNPAMSALSEIGQSMSTVSYTLDLVPAVRPFDLGASYVYAMIAVIPNVGWDVHPTMAHGTLSTWLVRTVEPSTAARGGGLGYSFIAEAYENFGWTGVPIVMIALGWVAGRLSSATRDKRDPAMLAMAATLLSFALIYARAETADFVRSICWYGLAPYLAVRLTSRGQV